MRDLEQNCGDCAWFKRNPELEQTGSGNLYGGPYGLCKAEFTSTRPHLPDARFEGLAIWAEGLVLGRSKRALYAEFGKDKFIPVETEFTRRLGVGTLSDQSCHEMDDRGRLLFTPK